MSDRDTNFNHNQRVIISRAVLLLTTFASVFLLFFPAFSIPYVNFVWLVEARLDSGAEVLLGTFGFCSGTGALKSCSPGVTGYVYDEVPSLGGSSTPIMVTNTRELVLHVVAFVLSLVTTTAVLCSLQQRRSLLEPWVVRLVALLIIFNLASFIADVALFSAAKHAFGTTTFVTFGNGTWLTFTSLILLLLGLVLYISQRRHILASQSSDVEATTASTAASVGHERTFSQQLEDKVIIISADRRNVDTRSLEKYSPDLLHDHKSHKLPNIEESKYSTETYMAHPTVNFTVHAENTGKSPTVVIPEAITALEKPAILSPVRRKPSIMINGTSDSSLNVGDTTTDTAQKLPSSASSVVCASSTYGSDKSIIYFTPSTLSRSSSTTRTSSFYTRHPARRSTLNPHALEQWDLPLAKRIVITRTMEGENKSPMSTFESVLHQFPTIPSPQVVQPSFAFLQYRDRFIENNPSIAMDVRSLASAVPSSDIELDVQTIAPNTPNRSFGTGTPHLPEPDEFSLA